MLSIIQTISLMGLDGKLVEVQTDISGGLPNFEIVGLPDVTVKESKERIKSAIKNSGVQLNSRKILINLAPSDIKKEGSGYDLPIAVGILSAVGAIGKFDEKSTIFIGELALDGKINKIPGILPICIEAKKCGIKKIFVPKENEKEAYLKIICGEEPPEYFDIFVRSWQENGGAQITDEVKAALAAERGRFWKN